MGICFYSLRLFVAPVWFVWVEGLIQAVVVLAKYDAPWLWLLDWLFSIGTGNDMLHAAYLFDKGKRH